MIGILEDLVLDLSMRVSALEALRDDYVEKLQSEHAARIGHKLTGLGIGLEMAREARKRALRESGDWPEAACSRTRRT